MQTWNTGCSVIHYHPYFTTFCLFCNICLHVWTQYYIQHYWSIFYHTPINCLDDNNVCLVIWRWEPQPHSPSQQQQCYSIPGPSPHKTSAVMQRQPAGLCLCQLGNIQNYVLCNFTLILYKMLYWMCLYQHPPVLAWANHARPSRTHAALEDAKQTFTLPEPCNRPIV